MMNSSACMRSALRQWPLWPAIMILSLLAPAPCGALTITAWQSGAGHGRGVGIATLEIPDDGSFCESRSGSFQILIITFDENINPFTFTEDGVHIAGLDANGQAVDLGGISISTSATVGQTGTIYLVPALPDYARYAVRITGVKNSINEPLVGDNDRILTMLMGDVSGDRQVNATDLSRVRTARTRLIDPNDPDQVRADLTLDGRVNSADLSRIRVRRSNDARDIAEPQISRPPYVEESGQVVIEAEEYHGNVSQGGHSWQLVISPGGYSGRGAMQALPDNGTNEDTNFVANSPWLDFQVDFQTTGTYSVRLRGYTTGNGNDTCHVGLDASAVDTSDRVGNFSHGQWYWEDGTTDGPGATLEIDTTGLHTINVWMCEDGFTLDQLELSFVPPAPDHPYLLLTPADLPEIRQRSQQQPALRFRQALQQQSSQLNPGQLAGPGRLPTYTDRVHASRMTMSALEGLLAEDSWRISRAKEALLNLTSWTYAGSTPNMSHGGIMRNSALSYDLLFNELLLSERQQVENFMAMVANFVYDGQAGGGHWTVHGSRGANWRATMYSGMGMVGLALKGVHPDANTWIAEASGILKDILDYDFDGEGGIYEALARYSLNVTYHSILPTMEALRRVTGEDLFDWNNQVLYRATPFIAYMLYPTYDAMPCIGDSDAYPYSIGLGLVKAAAEYNDGLAAWYLDELIQHGWSPGSDSAICGTLWARPVATEDPNTSPRLSEAYAYNNDAATKQIDQTTDHATGHVVLRTGFTDTEDIYFACQAADCQGFHDHADKGSYVLAAYGVKFLRDYFAGSYDGAEFVYRHSGEAHQTVLVDGIGQGTQEHGLTDPYYFTKVADVETLEIHTGYDYVRMNLVTAYRFNPSNSTMQKAMRHVVFIRKPAREGYFVVIDDVKRDDSTHTYSHPFHYEPEVSVKTAQNGLVILGNSTADLHISAVVPDTLTASQQTKYNDSFVMLTCSQPVVRFVMVTVLYPARAGEQVPAFTPIDDGNTAGVEIDGVYVEYDKSTDTVSVSGNLSNVTARQGGQ